MLNFQNVFFFSFHQQVFNTLFENILYIFLFQRNVNVHEHLKQNFLNI